MNATAFDRQSYMQDSDFDARLFPKPKTPYARAEGQEPAIDLGNGHKLHAQEFGNPKGEPVIILHGGPGGGCSATFARYPDPSRYRIILFDQRGCGNSTPTTHSDLAAAMEGNNTAQLVEDINAVRKHFGIRGKTHIEGGSWGSTLALAYATKYPENVKSLILRGVFLGVGAGISYLFQGNAATYTPSSQPVNDDSTQEQVDAFLAEYDAQDHSREGSYRAYIGDGSLEGQIPQEYHASHQHMRLAYARAWDAFVRAIPQEDRGNLVEAYVNRLEATADETLRGSGTFDAASGRIDPEYQLALARGFAQWEYAISFFSQPVEKNGKVDIYERESTEEEMVDFARIEARYMHDGCYMTPDGSPIPGGSTYLLDNLSNIAKHNIPMQIVHGKHDQVCPSREAVVLANRYREELAKAVPNEEERAEVNLQLSEKAGHARIEFTNTQGYLNAFKNAARMTRAEVLGDGPQTTTDHTNREPGPRAR